MIRVLTQPLSPAQPWKWTSTIAWKPWKSKFVQKTWKQRFLAKIFACGGQNSQKFSPAVGKTVKILACSRQNSQKFSPAAGKIVKNQCVVSEGNGGNSPYFLKNSPHFWKNANFGGTSSTLEFCSDVRENSQNLLKKRPNSKKCLRRANYGCIRLYLKTALELCNLTGYGTLLEIYFGGGLKVRRRLFSVEIIFGTIFAKFRHLSPPKCSYNPYNLLSVSKKQCSVSRYCTKI